VDLDGNPKDSSEESDCWGWWSACGPAKARRSSTGWAATCATGPAARPTGGPGSASVSAPGSGADSWQCSQVKSHDKSLSPKYSYNEQSMSQFLSRKRGFIAVLAALLLALGASAYGAPRTSGLWWMPDVASKSGEQIDQLTYFIYYLTGGVFILTQVVYIYFLIRYRARRGVRATYLHGDNRLELIWTAIPTAIFIGLWGYSNHMWWDVIHTESPKDTMEIAVTAYQFGFSFQYPGATGKLGRSDVKLISADNMFGNDQTDPATKEDFQSGVLELAVDKPVRIRLNSKDVIHGFYIPQFRVYQDAVPGRTIDWVWFIPTKTGSYQLACSQLCGSGHYNMKAQIEVVSQPDFDKWYKEKVAAANASSGNPPARSK
jgi:cytochrome c oxidase subunit 2